MGRAEGALGGQPGAVVEAAEELRERGTYGFWERAGPGAKAARSAFKT